MMTESTQKDIIVSLKGVTKDYQNGESVSHVLKGIDLDIYKGEFLVILGPSGCGKTTLLNIIGGMDNTTAGSLYFHDKDYSNATEKELTEYRREHIGFIFQTYNLMPNLTALQNVCFIAELKKNSGNPEKALELVGLKNRKNNYPSQLSGGEQQRVAIARAVVKNPELILADEPTAALDYNTGIEILGVIEDLAKTGASIVMVTHNKEIAKMAKRVIKLRDGMVDEVIVNEHPASATELIW